MDKCLRQRLLKALNMLCVDFSNKKMYFLDIEIHYSSLIQVNKDNFSNIYWVNEKPKKKTSIYRVRCIPDTKPVRLKDPPFSICTSYLTLKIFQLLTTIHHHPPIRQVHILVSSETLGHQLFQQQTAALLLGTVGAVHDELGALADLLQADVAPFVQVQDVAALGEGFFPRWWNRGGVI